MNRLYKKSQLSFTLIWIAIYCLLQSLANPLNQWIGVDWAFNLIFCIIQVFILLRFLSKQHLNRYYGLCRSAVPARRFLYYIPLLILASGNLWNGVSCRDMSPAVILRVATMLCVGLLEELLFRGLLFRALLTDGVKMAVIVSSVTFGLGHILNLFNGSSAALADTIRQITYACAVGFLFVTIYYHSGSLLPCIFTHSAINVLAVFGDSQGLTSEWQITYMIMMVSVALCYAIYINVRLKAYILPAADERTLTGTDGRHREEPVNIPEYSDEPRK